MRTVRKRDRIGADGTAPKPFRALVSVPVLPSMVTLGNLFFGFLAMAKAVDAVVLQGAAPVLTPATLALFEAAALLVFLAMVFDALDGAVARLTNQTSAFGAQLDSLADVVTFGVAPAFLAKILIDFHARGPEALLPENAKMYWAAAAIYVLCAAMRLARYNVEGDQGSGDEFVGLPTPAAAAVVCAGLAFFATRADNKQMISRWVLPPGTLEAIYDYLVLALPVALVLLGLLMVSRFPYPHLVSSLVRGRHSFPFLATLVVAVFVAAIEWQFALVLVSVSYVVVGILIGLWRLLRGGSLGPPGGDHSGATLDEDALDVRYN